MEAIKHFQIITLHSLNLHHVTGICQLYFSKVGGKQKFFANIVVNATRTMHKLNACFQREQGDHEVKSMAPSPQAV